MKISGIRSITGRGRHRISATVTWEDSDRNPLELYFETTADRAEYLTASPEPFVIAAFVPAIYAGERRLTVDAPVCPQLLRGLEENLGWLRHWHGKTTRLDIAPAAAPRFSGMKGRTAASFLSGGVDSLHTLRLNQLQVPAGHPMAIQDCILVDGFDMSWDSSKGPQDDIFFRALDGLAPLAVAANVRLLPIRTNLRHLNDSVMFWMEWFYGAALASVANACAAKFHTVTQASASDDVSRTGPWGSTPFTDANYSSSAVRIVHDSLWVTRLEKIRLIAEWPAALQSLRVCTANRPERINCGKCEKCTRTMIALIAVGRLQDTQVFGATDVSEQAFGTMWLREAFVFEFYAELVEPLRRCGRADLVRGIRTLQARHRKQLARQQGNDLKGRIKRFDRTRLGGMLAATKRGLRPGTA